MARLGLIPIGGRVGRGFCRPPGTISPHIDLLIADADATLLGDDMALQALRRVVAQRRIAVMVNSSRSVASVRRSLRGRLAPMAIAGGMGTELEMFGRRVAAWERRFAAWDAEAVHAILAGLGLTPHPAEHQLAAKVSYAVPPARRPEVSRALAAAPPHRVVVSGATDFDVIPRGAGKGAVARYAARRLGVPEHRVVTAGDSANDADLLGFGTPILVGNATPGLRRALRHRPIRPARLSRASAIREALA